MKDSGVKRWSALIVAVAIIVAALYIMVRPAADKPGIGENQPSAQPKTYMNAKYGIEFSYPDMYVLAEQDIGNTAERDHHAIAIIRAEDAAHQHVNGEGPTAITIDIYGN